MRKGQKMPEEVKRKIGDANRGGPGRGTGWHHSEETKQKIGTANKGRTRKSWSDRIGDKNPNWKGGKAYYHNSHVWVREKLNLPKGAKVACTICGTVGPVTVHNKSRKYKRQLSDWVVCCRKCHKQLDREYRAKHGIPHAKGWKHSEKMSEAHSGKTLSEVHKRNISKSLLRRNKTK